MHATTCIMHTRDHLKKSCLIVSSHGPGLGLGSCEAATWSTRDARTFAHSHIAGFRKLAPAHFRLDQPILIGI